MREVLNCIDSQLGLLNVFDEENISLIEKESTSLGGLVLSPGQKTTLNNFFESEVTYLGIYRDFLQFDVGEVIDLFGKTTWCNEYKRIDENRIVNIYKPGTARDYNFKNGFWK